MASRRILLFSFIVFFCFSATAEYRVFVLTIIDSATGQTRNVTTTLDHLQYASYYPVRMTELVSIQDTWMCRRRSDLSQDIEQKYCPNPKAATPPANSAGPKA